MHEEQSEVVTDFLANIKKEGVDPFEGVQPDSEPDDKEKETLSDSPAGEKPTESNPPQDGDKNSPVSDDKLPFHKHPRWIAAQEERKRLEEQLAELSEFKSTVEPLLPQLKKDGQPPTTKSLPAYWVKLYGDSDDSREAYDLYSAEQSQLQERIKSEAIAGASALQEAQAKEHDNAVKQWQGYIEGQLQTLKDSGKQFDRNELLKIVEDYSPRDSKGEYANLISFEKAYDILQLQKASKKDSNDARKDLAARTGADGKEGTPQPTTNAIGSLAKKDWWSWQN